MSQRRITKIEIKDYRAFYGAHQITLPKGENLLVYGENGSGKTSLYRALKDYFESMETDAGPGLTGNWYSTAVPQVSITFADFENGSQVSNSEITVSVPEIMMAELGVLIDEIGDDIAVAAEEEVDRSFIYAANLAKGFFSYREMLATHLSNQSFGEFDLFEILVKVILRNYIEPGTDELILELWESLKLDKSKLSKFIQDNPAPDEKTQEQIEILQADLAENLNAFQNRLESSLILLEPDINAINAYFEHGVAISFDFKEGFDSPGLSNLTPPQVFLNVKYNDNQLSEHHLHLNEARLSALAISIFLASVLHNPTKNVYKAIFLDDIFLGLDTGNRRPLLRVLNDKFYDFQVFITTYDRLWFEIAGKYLQGNWKKIEMYVEHLEVMEHPDGIKHQVGRLEHPASSKKLKFEAPLIIDPSESNLAKADKAFRRKDYPGCANFQRKYCEELLKAYLQENYKLTFDKTDKVKTITNLSVLFSKLQQFYKDCGLTLPHEITDEFDLYRTAVMNPFSHDDLESPVYRQELERGFKIIEALEGLKPLRKGTVAYRDDIIEYSEPSIGYYCRFKITSEPLSLIRHGNDISIFQGKGDVIGYTKNGVERAAPAVGMQGLSIDKFCQKISTYLATIEGFTPNPDRFSALVLCPQKISLRQIIEG
ncbi:MAG: hypothetical protein R3D58_13690 [Saprospiraceae bacterium]